MHSYKSLGRLNPRLYISFMVIISSKTSTYYCSVITYSTRTDLDAVNEVKDRFSGSARKMCFLLPDNCEV